AAPAGDCYWRSGCVAWGTRAWRRQPASPTNRGATIMPAKYYLNQHLTLPPRDRLVTLCADQSRGLAWLNMCVTSAVVPELGEGQLGTMLIGAVKESTGRWRTIKREDVREQSQGSEFVHQFGVRDKKPLAFNDLAGAVTFQKAIASQWDTILSVTPKRINP